MADDEPRQSSASRLTPPRAPASAASRPDPMEVAIEYVMLAQGSTSGPHTAAQMRTKLLKLHALTGSVQKSSILLDKARKTYRLLAGKDTRPGQ